MADISMLDAMAWSYIGKRAICGDPDAQSLIDLLDRPAPDDVNLEHMAALIELQRLRCLLQQQEDELDALRSIVADKNLEDNL